MKLAAIRRPLVSLCRHLPALCCTIIFTLALSGSPALALGRGHGGGGFGGGHVGSFRGGQVGSFGGGQFRGGRFGAGHFAGGQFGGRQFGRFPGGIHNFSDNRFFFRHGHGFHAFFAFGFPVVGPYYAYPSYPYYADPYCDPYSPWYNPSYCYWRYRAH